MITHKKKNTFLHLLRKNLHIRHDLIYRDFKVKNIILFQQLLKKLQWDFTAAGLKKQNEWVRSPLLGTIYDHLCIYKLGKTYCMWVW